MKSLQTRTTTFHSTPIVRGFLNQKYSELSKASDKFTDPLFPPEETSLYSTKSDHKDYEPPEIPKFLLDTSKNKFLSQFALSNKEDQYVWKRLSELYNTKDLNIIKETKSENGLCGDVIQGELGDCYFLSAISALAENPERIRNLFPTQKISDKGIYETLVYLHGEPTNIVLDDYVPCIETPGAEPQIAFAGLNPETNNIWPILLEKVWAKCNLSYEDITAGNSAEAFEFLCPAPFDTFYHNADTKQLFDIITSAHKKGYIIVSDITETDNTNLDYLSKMGLITNHAYSVIDTAVLRDSHNGNEIRLIKIRNPWGTNEWLGDWSDGSRKWSEEFKQIVGLEEKEDGVFWMSYEDFIQFYTSTHICHIHDDYEFVSKKFPVESEEPFNIVSINVPKDSSGYFEVNMKNTRIYKNLKGLDEFENPFCCMTVFKKEDDGLVYIGSDSGHQDRLYVECEDMKKGNYYVLVTFPKQKEEFELSETFQYRNFEKMTYRVGVYSPFDELNISPLSEREKLSLANFFDDLISEMAYDNKERYYFVQEGERTSYRVINFDDSRCGFGYIFYENNSEAFIRERVSIKELENVNIIPMLKKGKFSKLQTTIDEEVEYEDPNTRTAMDNLKQNVDLPSTVDVIKGSDKEISEKNPIIVQFNIAPHSQCIILLQKNDDDAAIDFDSDICFDYLPSVLLAEERFRPKRFMLKYNNKPVEIYECVTEHNTGVLFQYKNKTKDLKVSITITFSNFDNLYLSLFCDDMKNNEDKALKLRENVNGKFRDDSDEDSVSLTIEPGENKFFGISAVDSFKKFSYNCHIDYHFGLSKGKITETESVEEQQVVTEENEN